eukprot:403335423
MNICDVSSKLATVEFDPPQKILKRDIEHFQILLWEIGKTRTFEQLKKVGSYTKLVFQNKIDDKLSEAYTIHNLNHSTAYRVQISLVFKPQNERTFDYWKSLQLPNGELKNLDSEEVMFNTAQQQIDEYIEKEMNFARETKREKSRKIQFAQSERVLYDFGNDQDQDYLYKKNTDHANKESLTQALYAARNHKSWKDFSKCGMKFSQPEYNKDKRLNRMLLVGNAIDAFQDVPEQNDGHQLMKNNWNMGPFYAWDKNYLQYTSDTYQTKKR